MIMIKIKTFFKRLFTSRYQQYVNDIRTFIDENNLRDLEFYDVNMSLSQYKRLLHYDENERCRFCNSEHFTTFGPTSLRLTFDGTRQMCIIGIVCDKCGTIHRMTSIANTDVFAQLSLKQQYNDALRVIQRTMFRVDNDMHVFQYEFDEVRRNTYRCRELKKQIDAL